MAIKITIPPVEDYRNYMRMVLRYMLTHFGFIGLGDLPPMGFEKLFSQADVQKFFDKLNAAKVDKPLKITLAEMLLMYACHVCMNKILVSKYDEFISPLILQQLPDDHHLKTFKAFRDEMLSLNSYLIKDTEKKMPKQKKLFELKDKLSEIEIE